MTAMLSAALRYVELGYAVFPCAPGTKAPLTVHGYQDASREPEQIEHWWTERPNANIGLATAGLLVLDIDTAENTWLQDDLDKRLELADAPLSLTPHGGRQCVFRQPAGRAWRNTAGDLAPRVDTRADGGYILAPPSALEDGAYRWAQGVELDVGPDSLPEPPAWLIAQLDAIAARRESSPASGDAAENVIPDGQRNNTLARLAGAMRRVGMSQAELLAALRQTNRDRCRPPLADDEVERIAASVARYAPDQVSVALVEDHWAQQFGASTQEQFRFAAITSAELAAGNYTLTYLVENLLVRGQPGVIAGPKKSLKTNVSIDLALALSQAGLFLGRFNVPQAVRVGVMSAESGAATIQETARRIGAAHDMPLEDFTNVVWSFDVPQLRNAVHIDALGAFVSDYALDVLILDPTYLMMLGLGNDAGNLFIVGELLKSLGELAQRTGCTPLLCHHLKKSVAEPYEPAELENIAWAGFQEFVRQWILLNRRVRYDPDQGGHHELWMSVGGSAGHSGLWGLDIEEGTPQDPGGRRWEIEVLSAHEAYAERSEAAQDAAEQRKQRQHESRRERQRNAVWEALRLFPDGETPRVIRETAGVSGAVVTEQLATLVQKGLAEQCTIKKHTREEPAFRPLQGGGTGGTVPARPSTG
jgi:hypothetical protein